MLPTGNVVTLGDGTAPLRRDEKAELKRLRASGPKARLVHVRHGDPPPYRMHPQREWAEIRISYEGAPPKKGAPPKAVAIARAVVIFHPKDDPSRHLVDGPPIGVKDLLNDMIRSGERVVDEGLPLPKRYASAVRFAELGDQLEEIGGENLAYNCYQATATQATLDAIDAMLRAPPATPPLEPKKKAPSVPPRAHAPRPKRPPKPPTAAGASTTPSPEALEARRQREAKHAQYEAEKRAAEKAAEAAHKTAMAERRAARAAEKAAAGGAEKAAGGGRKR